MKSKGYQISWQTNQTPQAVGWQVLNPLTLKWAAGDILSKNSGTLPYKESHCLGNKGAYKIVASINGEENESAPFTVTWVDGFTREEDARFASFLTDGDYIPLCDSAELKTG